MMEMLKRFKDEDAAKGEGSNEVAHSEEDLAERLSGLDIDSISHEALWDLLTRPERASFLKVMQDPASEAAQALLRSQEFEHEIGKEAFEPWWEASSSADSEEGSTEFSWTLKPSTKRYGHPPEVMQIPPSMCNSKPSIKGKDPTQPLVYNVCALLIGYAYVTRHLTCSPLSSLSQQEVVDVARQLLRSVLPFFSPKGAKLVYATLDEALRDMYSRLVGTKKFSREVFCLLVRDASNLMTAAKIVEFKPPNDANADLSTHPYVSAIQVLSDIAEVFSAFSSPHEERRDEQKQHRTSPVSMKMRFYAAYLVVASNEAGVIVGALADALRGRAERIERDGDEFRVGGDDNKSSQ